MLSVNKQLAGAVLAFCLGLGLMIGIMSPMVNTVSSVLAAPKSNTAALRGGEPANDVAKAAEPALEDRKLVYAKKSVQRNGPWDDLIWPAPKKTSGFFDDWVEQDMQWENIVKKNWAEIDGLFEEKETTDSSYSYSYSYPY